MAERERGVSEIFQAHYQGAGPEEEPSGLEPLPGWDTCSADIRLTHNTTVPTPALFPAGRGLSHAEPAAWWDSPGPTPGHTAFRWYMEGWEEGVRGAGL